MSAREQQSRSGCQHQSGQEKPHSHLSSFVPLVLPALARQYGDGPRFGQESSITRGLRLAPCLKPSMDSYLTKLDHTAFAEFFVAKPETEKAR